MASFPVIAPPPPRQTFRFAFPPSLGADEARERARALEQFLTGALGKKAEVVVGDTYESLAKELLAGRVDAAWAPPFVCARIEAMGVRILVRGVRQGSSSYRAAILSRADRPLSVEQLAGTSAAWTDRDSVGGYLLAMAHLRAKGLDPRKLFFKQQFAGSYRQALEAVLAGEADVTSVFAPAARSGAPDGTGVEEVLPGKGSAFHVVAFTDESPNDGIAVSMSTAPAVVTALEKSLLSLHGTPDGARLLREAFAADRFEAAPRMGYRALYRVALASL